MKRAHTVMETRRALRRTEILGAAAGLFFESGYGRTSMDDIVARVGGSKRTLYTHFSNKEDLFAAFVRDVSERVLNDLDLRLEGDIDKALCSLGEQYMGVLLSPDMLQLYRVLVAEGRFFPELSKTFFENGPGRIAERLTRFFAKKHQDGLARIDDPKTAALLFIGMLRSDHHLAAVLTGRTYSKQEIKKSVSAAVQTLLCGAVVTRSPLPKKFSCREKRDDNVPKQTGVS